MDALKRVKRDNVKFARNPVGQYDMSEQSIAGIAIANLNPKISGYRLQMAKYSENLIQELHFTNTVSDENFRM